MRLKVSQTLGQSGVDKHVGVASQHDAQRGRTLVNAVGDGGGHFRVANRGRSSRTPRTLLAGLSLYACIGWASCSLPFRNWVRARPGSMIVTPMLKAATSVAVASMNPSMPHLVAWYIDPPGPVACPPQIDIWMMRPPPCARRCGSAASGDAADTLTASRKVIAGRQLTGFCPFFDCKTMGLGSLVSGQDLAVQSTPRHCRRHAGYQRGLSTATGTALPKGGAERGRQP